jgi:hypothetical protein
MKDLVRSIMKAEEESAAEKQPKPKVAYEKAPDGFFLYTIDPRATKILAKHGVKFRYQQRPQSYFVAFVDKLVRRPGVFYYEHKIEAPEEKHRDAIEKLNQKRLRMGKVLERMTEEYAKVEEELASELQKHGLKLKPGAPLDAQLLDRKEHDGMHFRLHFRQALKRSYNQEAVEELAKKYPVLKDALKTRETPYLDKQELENALPQLPANVAALIISLTPISSFNDEPLTNPECSYCGGKLLKAQVCRHCGLSESQE